MRSALALGLVLGSVGFALAGCGTSYGPGGQNGAGGGNAAGNAQTAGQDTNAQPATGGLKTPAYTSANNACSLYPLSVLAQQNNVKATPDAVAKVYAAGETTAKGKKEAYRGCIDALKQKGGG
jgi:hypothetical protein